MGLTTCRTSFYSRIPSFPVPKRRPLLRRRDDDDDSSPPRPANRTRIRSSSNRPAQSSLFQSKQRVRGRRYGRVPTSFRVRRHGLDRTIPFRAARGRDVRRVVALRTIRLVFCTSIGRRVRRRRRRFAVVVVLRRRALRRRRAKSTQLPSPESGGAIQFSS